MTTAAVTLTPSHRHPGTGVCRTHGFIIRKALHETTGKLAHRQQNGPQAPRCPDSDTHNPPHPVAQVPSHWPTAHRHTGTSGAQDHQAHPLFTSQPVAQEHQAHRHTGPRAHTQYDHRSTGTRAQKLTETQLLAVEDRGRVLKLYISKTSRKKSTRFQATSTALRTSCDSM